MIAAFRKKKVKSFPVRVCSLDSTLEFDLQNSSTGGELFEQVCRAFGLREEWYFGLQYEDCKGNICWLKKEKKVIDQNISRDSHCEFMFIAKFFPENVQDELIQEITQHLFFLQIKQAILSMEYYCPPEASVLLASYYVQAKYGDYDDSVWNTVNTGMLSSEDLLPQRVIDQYSMTPEMWFERIKTWYADHKGMSRDESEMEYLKISQDLDMFGVNYFPIANKKHSELWLGITALGLNIYEKENKLQPRTVFQWSEIKNISFDDKKFTIKPIDKNTPNFVFFVHRQRNKLILDLCIGNHELFMRRRKPDTMEIQQMKAQAKEEKQRRQVERNKLAREKQLREQAEREKAMLEGRLLQLQEEMRNANAALKRSEEAAELLEQKNHLAEEEAMLLSRKAMEVEQEILKLKNYALKTEEEKIHLERKSREAESLTARLVEESQKRASEAERLKNELINARVAEKEAKEKLLTFLSATISSPSPMPIQAVNLLTPDRYMSVSSQSLNDSHNSPHHNYEDSVELNCSYDLVENNDISEISLEIEKERTEYLQKSKQVQCQLKDLRSEIEMLKISESEFDRINTEQLKLGENKYSTLKKALKQKFFFL